MPAEMVASLPYPALHATHAGIWLAHGDGRVEALGRGAAIARAAETPLILLNAPLIGSRLGYPELNGLDLLELFAFVHPARFAVPTPKGMADALGLDAPADDAGAAGDIGSRLAGTRGRLGLGASAAPAALALVGGGFAATRAARARRALALLPPAPMGGIERAGPAALDPDRA
jgi:ATP-dependent DNA helicase DinG